MAFILHSDLNNFYASVECMKNTSLKNEIVIVIGEQEKRKGIVLSKNEKAKALGVKTGDTVWEAEQKAGSSLVCINANFALYSHVAEQVKNIYRRYSDRVESFGIDEAWIDISKLTKTFEGAQEIAHEIRRSVQSEIGVTVSVGVSFNKIFAKLGSDLKKPNAVTVITPENFKEKVWCLPVRDLLFVGRATGAKLARAGINTIGELAQAGKGYLKSALGKNGATLYDFANGLNGDEVKAFAEIEKSIGNSTTCLRDLKNDHEVKTVLYVLAENVVKRMRRRGFFCEQVSLYVKDATLHSFERQKKLSTPTNLVQDLVREGMELFKKHYCWQHTVRAVGIRASAFTNKPVQLSIFSSNEQKNKISNCEAVVEKIREKYGSNALVRAAVSQAGDFVSHDVDTGLHSIMYKGDATKGEISE